MEIPIELNPNARLPWRRHELFGGVTLCVLLMVLPLIGGARLLDLLIITLLFVVMAAGLYLVVGLCQLFDLGYAGFVCLGAYTTGVLLTKFQFGYVPAALGAMLIAVAAGILLGLPTLPLRGDYFAIVTFGFSEIVILLMRNWTGLTGGPYGLGGIPDPVFFGVRLNRYPPLSYYFLMLVIAAGVLSMVWLLRRTMLGSQMVAVGDDEKLCGVTGIDVVSVKLAAFALSAGIGGLVGSFWAVYFKFISYLDFTLNLSVQVICIVILAGDRRIRSLLLAAAIIAPTSEILRITLRSFGLPEASRIIFFGLILILLSLWRARGTSQRSLFDIALSRFRRRFGNPIPEQPMQIVAEAAHRGHDCPTAGDDSTLPAATPEPAITVGDLHVSFGGTKALNGIDMTVNKGEALAIVGANGSGKTSLLNAISGLIEAKGIIELYGRDVGRLPTWTRARLGLVRTFQHPRRFDGLTWTQNLHLASFTLAQAAGRAWFHRIRAVVQSGFTGLPAQTTGKNRKGEASTEAAAHLQLERAFESHQSVILLDEPLAGKPSSWCEYVLNGIRNHKRAGGSVIVVEHNVEAILPVIDRILMLDKGHIKFLGPIADFLLFKSARPDQKC